MVSREKDRGSDLTAPLGEWLSAFRNGSVYYGKLASDEFCVNTSYLVGGFGASVVGFGPIGLRDIRRKPELYLAPLGGPLLAKGAKEDNFWGALSVDFANFNPERLRDGKPDLKVTFKILPVELLGPPGQEELVMRSVPRVYKSVKDNFICFFDRIEDEVGQKKILILPFAKNDNTSLTRLLFCLKVKFEEK